MFEAAVLGYREYFGRRMGVSLSGNSSPPAHDPACLAVANRALVNELGLLFSEGNARRLVSVFGGAEATFGLAMLNRDEPRS